MIKVLVVDDHAVVRRGLAALLATATDLELVGMAVDGAEAVRLALESGADVVVMDLSMPGVDGVAAIRLLATQAPGCRVLVLTSFSDQARVSDSFEPAPTVTYSSTPSPRRFSTASGRWFAAERRSTLPAARILLNTSRSRRAGATDELTGREREVLALVATGLNNRQIGRRLDITERTVKSHLHNIFQRLGVTHRTEAALWAQRNL